ncbi:MAG: DUF2309 domain-containing protein [Gemmataceae bacterium]|nr:DUF2309 domain-containing protein [Gemmataceae bacterium]
MSDRHENMGVSLDDHAIGSGPHGDALLLSRIEHAAHYLPAQGPIAVFIHHNTLHGFEHLPFREAVESGARVFGCEPYLPEPDYRAAFRKGRIREVDLEAAMRDEYGDRLSEALAPALTRQKLYAAILQYRFPTGTAEELRWYMAEHESLRRVRPDVSAVVRSRFIAETRRWAMRDLRAGTTREPRLRGVESWGDSEWESFALESLWQACRDRAADVPATPEPASRPLRVRDLLLRQTGVDADLLVDDILIPFVAAFLDQGVAHWPLPDREAGFYRSFIHLFGEARHTAHAWHADLLRELSRLHESHTTPLASIRESLAELGVAPADEEQFFIETLLALRGWAGMVRQVETRADRVIRPIPAGSLVEFLAIRLILDRVAANYIAGRLMTKSVSLAELRTQLPLPAPRSRSKEQRAFPLFQLAQIWGWTAADVLQLSPAEMASILTAIETFTTVERRRVLHAAYERRFRTTVFDALMLQARTPAPTPAAPRFQAVFCIDEREESFRRHLEEIAPDCVTFGTAGFFGVAVYFRGIEDAHFTPLCPIVIRPKHWLIEESDDDVAATGRRSRTRKLIGEASRRVQVGSRGLGAGAILTTAFGVLATAPLVARTLLPRLTARIRSTFQRVVAAPTTHLHLERTTAEPGPDGSSIGFSVSEMADIGERVLRDIGMTRVFSRLVFFIAHGSGSQNNPHKSAYDCGACGGSPGSPNGRSLAQMLNDPRVRDRLRTRGIAIPDSTWFVGGLHNTCADSIRLFDTGAIPASHQAEFDRIEGELNEAADRNAHERCRRFETAPLDLTPRAAHNHVEARSEDLAQTRPELGHATNAICIVGRRERTRGLFLDRRAFLTSYDPTQDTPEAAVLTRTLQAVVPVCGGINLEYYFSRTDNARYGCGSKLPHNVTGLLGVMDGAASDLRTGLPWQMVEIHEPVRMVMVIETTPEIMLGVMAKNPSIDQFFRNEWSHLALLDPHSPRLKWFVDGEFRDVEPSVESLPHSNSSADWYRGWRDHLEFASIRSPRSPA